jgi:DNA-binding beta-propeller fold protein YncE
LYWSNGNRCYVLDCPTGTVIDSLQDDGLGECVLAWNPSDDRLYAGCNNYDSTLLVYDAATNQLLTLIPDVWNVTAMVWDSVNHKLYATNVNGWLYVIDGATNTVDTVVHSVGYGQAWRLTCNPVNSRLYVEDRDDWPVSINLTTFDYNDLGGGPKGVVAWLPEQDRLYAAGFEGIARFDCEAETLVKQVLATYWHGQLLWNPRSNRLYLAPDENLDLVIADCAADSVITTLDAGDYAQGIAWNPNNNRVFITNSRDGTITVVADSSTAVTESGQRDQSQTPALFAIGGVLQLPPEPEVREMCLLDASGRRCARLHSGSNDVSRLAAGVYFLRRRGASTDSCTRVIVN